VNNEMNNQMEEKILLLTPPGALVDNASLATASVDAAGWDRLSFYIILGATDIAMAALKVQTADADTGYADLPNGDFSTGIMTDGNASILPAASGATGDNTIHAVHIDLRGKKRWFDLLATGGDGSVGAYFTVIAILSRPKISPSTMAGRGLAQELAA
jgi:hypothetical protein